MGNCSSGATWLSSSTPTEIDTYFTPAMRVECYSTMPFVQDQGLDKRITIVEESSLKDSFDNVIKVKKGILPKFQLAELEND